jgi:NADH-quinone oxidoreductase subunit N
VNGSSIFALLAPELILTGGACLVLLIGLIRSRAGESATNGLALFTVLAALATIWQMGPPEAPVAALGVRLTNLAWYVRLITLSIGLLVLLIHLHLPTASERGELLSLILVSMTGILLTSLADDLVLLFLAIELVSVPTYVLVSIGRSDIRAQEAGVKYFFLGALSAALLAYGLAFLYGASGDTSLRPAGLDPASGYATLGLLLAFAGIAFKIAAVPFHVYAADVYQGAASPVTGLLGFFPKLAGFVALVKLILFVQPGGPVDYGWALPPTAFLFLWVVAAATMIAGNVLGLLQTNVKRILAYSSIAHSGYILLAVLAGPIIGGGPLRDGLSAMLFYITAYALMNLGAFAVLAMLAVRGRAVEELADLAGLARRHPAAALALAVCIFSLMGMPPTAGFLGKVYVFTAALSAGPEHPHASALVVLAVIGVINAAVGAVYYLRIVAACYLGEEDSGVTLVPRDRALQLGVLGCSLAVLVIGVWPQGLMRMARQPFYHLREPQALVQTATEPLTHAGPVPGVELSGESERGSMNDKR